MTEKRVTVNDRGRVTLGAGFAPGKYLAQVAPDGAIVLQSAVVVTKSDYDEMQKLASFRANSQLRTSSIARHLQDCPNTRIGDTSVFQCLHGFGLGDPSRAPRADEA